MKTCWPRSSAASGAGRQDLCRRRDAGARPSCMAGTADKLTLIGELGRRRQRARAGASPPRSTRAGLDTTVSDNIIGTIWDKLLVNVATGALSGITRPALRPAVRGARTRSHAPWPPWPRRWRWPRASGVTLSHHRAGRGLAHGRRRPARRIQGRRCCKAWKKARSPRSISSTARWCAGANGYGVPTPVNQTLVACIKGIEKAHCGRCQAAARAATGPRHDCRDGRWPYTHSNPTSSTSPCASRTSTGTSASSTKCWAWTCAKSTARRDAPRQYWTLGGMQLMSTPDFAAPPSNDAGWLAHLGVMCEDLEAALAAAQSGRESRCRRAATGCGCPTAWPSN